ncbi:hypothetical protein RJ55_04817 [Drechmeria coniospora]|nr:hypothetical protein RJ55_04817 [Drechmeria coniospora]
MEPSSKKRKLAPKVNPSALNSQPVQYSYESSQQPSQQQHPVHEPPPVAERHDFESFARHLQDAAMLIQRRTERPTYMNASVLLLSWQGDDHFENDIASLERVFQKQYGFDTQRWEIPAIPHSGAKLAQKLATFLDSTRPGQLLIVFYAGHDQFGSDNQLYWACDDRVDAVKIKWDGVRCLLEDAQSDILLLLDSCGIADAPLAGSHSIKQAIAAHPSGGNPRDDSTKSFTANLTDALHKLSTGRPFSVQKLYDELLSQKQQQLLQTSRIPNGGNTDLSPRSRMPLFFALSSNKGQNLILAPLMSRRPESQHGAEGTDGHNNATRAREDDLIDFDSVADLRFDEARILVCTTFVGDASPDMAFFNQWLQNTPPLASKIAVEGMFLGPPTMLLISMPHSIWDVVQHDKVCCFLGYISSHNMIHVYEKLVGPGGVRPSAKEVEDGRILLEARELAAGTPARIHRKPDGHEPAFQPLVSRDKPPQGDRSDAQFAQGSPTRISYASVASGSRPTKPKDEVQDSAEMQEAAEQLKALSHVRHCSDEAVPAGQRPRTSLPDSLPSTVRDNIQQAHDASNPKVRTAAMEAEPKSTSHSRLKAARRAVPKLATRCSHCSHAPFKDLSSLRKHIAAAHTRPFPCAFSFAGCTSTFGSKNEWKRHMASQHLCLQFYRCSQCPQSAVEGKGNEFNRKDLFTQHLRRMHAPFQVKRAAMSKAENELVADWDEHVKKLQQTCLVTRRQPPRMSVCPKPGCQHMFEGPGSWDEWTEHVGRHMEKGESQSLEVDPLLAQWAVQEGIIEPKGGGEYRLCASNGPAGGTVVNGNALLDRRDSSTLMPMTDSSQMEDSCSMEAQPTNDHGEGQPSAE